MDSRMILQILRITAVLAILFAPLGAAGEVSRHYRSGDFASDPVETTIRAAADCIQAGCLICLAGILFVCTDIHIRKRDDRDPERASYRDNPTPHART